MLNYNLKTRRGFLGNWFIIPGAVGLWMFLNIETKALQKSNAVCSLTVVSFVVLFILAILLVIAQEAGR